MTILAIDLGSTFFKAAVFGRSLKLLGEGRAPLKYHYETGGVVELSVANVEKCFRSAIREAITLSRIKTADISAVVITSQAQTFTVCPENGKPKIPFISWLDTRPRQASPARLPDFGIHCGFNEQIPELLVSKLIYLQKKTGNKLVGRTDRVFILPTWFVWKLTGKAVIDNNQAAMTGLYSLVSKGWWPEALKKCRISEKNLPALAPLASVAAHTTKAAEAWGIPSGIPVVLAGNDQTAGAWGVDLHRNKGILITLGTAQVAYRCMKSLPPPREGCLRGPYGDGLFYQLAADDCGCSVVDWAVDLLTEGSDYESFFEAAASVPPGCDGLIFEPEIVSDKGCWHGIGRHHTTAHFARSVIESLVVRMVNMSRLISPRPGAGPVLVAGGGSRHVFWVDLLDKALGTTLTVSSASPLPGAVKMAAYALRKGITS